MTNKKLGAPIFSLLFDAIDSK